jgi:hypothetical protein
MDSIEGGAPPGVTLPKLFVFQHLQNHVPANYSIEMG